MKNTFIVVILSILLVYNATAQVKNISIGVSPYGSTSISLSKGEKMDDLYKLKYNSYFNVHLAYEPENYGASFLLEGSYTKAGLSKIENNDSNDVLQLSQHAFNDLSIFSCFGYYGLTTTPGRRFQVPFYLGIGVDYIRGKPITSLLFELAIKVKMRYYLTDRFGLYVGCDGKAGVGGRVGANSVDNPMSVSELHWNINGGIIFSL